MNMQQVRSIAKAHGIKASKLSKVALIRQIQRSEGNFDCFASDAQQQCDQTQCLWRSDCGKAALQSARH